MHTDRLGDVISVDTLSYMIQCLNLISIETAKYTETKWGCAVEENRNIF